MSEASDASAVKLPAEGGTRYPCFDGIRAIAALMVIVYHSVFFASFFETTGQGWLWYLNTGVWVFFVTSAFLLYRPFAAAHLSPARGVNVGRYAIRRIARIYPAYWVVLTFFLFIVPRTAVEGSNGYWLDYSLTFSYTHLKFPYLNGLPLAWSLVVELTFYLFLPFYALVISRAARRWRARDVEVGGVIVLFGLGVAALIAGAEGYHAPWITVLPVHLPAFALGILLAVLSTAQWSDRFTTRLARAGDRPWLWWSSAGVLFLVMPILFGSEPFPSESTVQAVGLAIVQALFGLFIVIPAVLGPQDRGRIRGLLRSRPLAWLGLISYGMYLWHWFVLQVVQIDWLGWPLRKGNWFLLLVLSLPVVISAAAASWYLVERPILRFVHRRTSGRLPTPATGPG